MCMCTRVVFCSEACRTRVLSDGGAHALECTGPPAVERNTTLAALQHMVSDWSRTKPEKGGRWDEEYRRTVTGPILRLGGELGGQSRTLQDFVDLADAGSVECAYMAGVQHKHRVTGVRPGGKGGQMVVESSTELPGVLTTDELAFKYLSQAAHGGHGLAMQSLADCYEAGTGIRADQRLCREWLWRSTLHKSAGAFLMLDQRSVLGKEHYAQVMNLERAGQRLLLGATMLLCRRTQHQQPPLRLCKGA
jgi:hypothetical protein